jgi:hypothetical protein
MKEDDTPLAYQKADKFETKRKMPEVPDLSNPGAPKKSAPFILDDFKGSNAYKGLTP